MLTINIAEEILMNKIIYQKKMNIKAVNNKEITKIKMKKKIYNVVVANVVLAVHKDAGLKQLLF